LKDQGIETLIHYPIPPHLQKAYVELGHGAGSFPVAERMAEEVLSLPLWPQMSEENRCRVTEVNRRIFLEEA